MWLGSACIVRELVIKPALCCRKELLIVTKVTFRLMKMPLGWKGPHLPTHFPSKRRFHAEETHHRRHARCNSRNHRMRRRHWPRQSEDGMVSHRWKRWNLPARFLTI